MWAKHRQGFTIVELLIVIVVIAILAVITIVAYNGIQTRAENQKTTSATKEYIKAFQAYALDNGAYPTTAGCLGDGYPAPNNRCLAQNGVMECWGSGGASNLTTTNALKPYMGNKTAQLSMQQIRCGNTTYVGGYTWYDSGTDQMGVMMTLRGDQTCPAMSPNVATSSKSFVDDGTRCIYMLSAV